MLGRLLPLLFLIGAGPQPPSSPVAVAAGEAGNVSVTVYRDPDRGEGAMDRRWPGGYALISETRTVTIPAGDSVIRFEGVAEGLLPETAIVTGLPKGVREKNRDARLLSPAGLVDAYLKRRVHLVRTNRKTGKVNEQDAVIQAGPGGGVILTTPQGIEALGCSGLPERMRYDGVPVGLTPRPTLSVLASSDRAMTVTVQLTYMAQGFDWGANYVAHTHRDDDKIGLFAWLTVANGGIQSFRDARLQVVAGRPNKVANAPSPRRPDPALHLRCWPMDTTSTHPRYLFERLPWMLDGSADDESNIVVTGYRRQRGAFPAPMAMMAPPPPPPPPPVVAAQEELGDLKLYRVPIRVDLAAQSQKQVAMIDQPAAAFARVYAAPMLGGRATPQAMPLVMRARNIADEGLGLPLPAGGLALFAPQDGQDLLIGERAMADRAIGEEVEIGAGTSPDVQWTLVAIQRQRKQTRWRATISNARAVDIRAEILVPGELVDRPAGLVRGPGGWRLPVTVAPNDRATLDFAVKAYR
ncbi:DUF4139 domain-containing protein [Sphingomonas sp. 28-63-12]|uniref:DUF4139 domain-containing protein n=1 Tax=Sphingomonas sp. 28-63-12 TaxID=1970434 RepID=UPI000BD7BB9C|nr:MAG: hypothetical protein B7Y47_06860 [Sphingomonas sp. 28-63-12]